MNLKKEKKVIGMTSESERAPVLPEALSENPDPKHVRARGDLDLNPAATRHFQSVPS
jgi:hypothetical protein